MGAGDTLAADYYNEKLLRMTYIGSAAWNLLIMLLTPFVLMLYSLSEDTRNLVILLVNFIQRTVFIYVLGRTLSGVNGVYTDVLSVLSLTELGIGTALNYSLYKPVAERDLEKIKSYMRFYKKAYLTIAGVIAVLGIAISPFLKFILKNPGNLTVRELTLYYYLFLFNTVISYFVTLIVIDVITTIIDSEIIISI